MVSRGGQSRTVRVDFTGTTESLERAVRRQERELTELRAFYEQHRQGLEEASQAQREFNDAMGSMSAGQLALPEFGQQMALFNSLGEETREYARDSEVLAVAQEAAAVAAEQQSRSLVSTSMQMQRAGDIAKLLISDTRTLERQLILVIGRGNQLGRMLGGIATLAVPAGAALAALAINWLRNREEADGAADAVERVRKELELLGAGGQTNELAFQVASGIDRAVQDWMAARDEYERARNEAIGGATTTQALWAKQALREAQETARALVLMMVEADVPAARIVETIAKYPLEIREAVEGMHEFQVAAASADRGLITTDMLLQALNGDITALSGSSAQWAREFVGLIQPVERGAKTVAEAFRDLDEELAKQDLTWVDLGRHFTGVAISQERLRELFPQTAREADRLSDAAERAVREWQEMGSQQRASALAAQALAAGYTTLDEALLKMPGFDAAVKRNVALAASERELEAFVKALNDLAGWNTGGGKAKTPTERMLEEFEEFGARAPRALSDVQAELNRYRATAAQAGDDHAVRLIDRLRQTEPTVQDIRSAIGSLQEQYGDLARADEEAARRQAEAARIRIRAAEEARNDALSSIDTLGQALTSAFRRQHDEEHADLLKHLARQRDEYLDAHNERLRQIQRERDEAIGAIDAEIAALRRVGQDTRLADLQTELERSWWDPRERKRIQDQIAEIERQATITQLEETKRGIQDEARERETAEKDELKRQQLLLDAQERNAKETYAELTEAWRLEARARELITAGNVDEISRITGAGLEKDLGLWQSFGESVVDGPLADIERKVRDVFALMGTAGGAAGGIGLAAANPNAEMIAALNTQGGLNKNAGVPAWVLENTRNQIRGLGGIPSFAREGYAASPMLAIVGDRPGGEHVFGDDTLRRVVREEVSRVGAGAPEVHVYIGDRELTDIVDVRIVAATGQAITRGGYGG